MNIRTGPLIAYYIAFMLKGIVWIPWHGGFGAHNVPILLLHTAWEATVILGVTLLLCVLMIREE
jgi:hypothetical protein